MEQQHLSSADEAGEAEARLVWLVDAAREDERARWARELHDDTLQGLATLRLKLSAARACSDAAELEQALEGAIQQVTREIGNLRALLVELRPPELRELGLAAALEALFDRGRELHGLTVTTDVRLR